MRKWFNEWIRICFTFADILVSQKRENLKNTAYSVARFGLIKISPLIYSCRASFLKEILMPGTSWVALGKTYGFKLLHFLFIIIKVSLKRVQWIFEFNYRVNDSMFWRETSGFNHQSEKSICLLLLSLHMNHDQETRLIQSTISRDSLFTVKEIIILLKPNTPICCRTHEMRHCFPFFPLHTLL